MIEINPELELSLGMGFVRNQDYIDFYMNLTAWNIYIQGKVYRNIVDYVNNRDSNRLHCGG